MPRTIRLAAILGLAWLVMTFSAGAQDTKKEPAKLPVKEPSKEGTKEATKDAGKDKAKKPMPVVPEGAPKKTHKVEKGLFKLEVTLKGILEAETMTEVYLTPEAYTPEVRGIMRVLKAVEHGTEVKKGDQLIWLDMERIDQILTDMEKDKYLADLGYNLAHEDLQALEKSTPLELTALERSKKFSDEDLKRFLAEEKEFITKSIQFDVKSMQNYLAYAKEELKQLEKMYKANDLTESTEEIILKRQRDMVERVEFYVKSAEFEAKNSLKVALPRREESMKEGNIKLALALEKTKTTLPLLMNQKKLILDRMKFERERANEKLQKMRKDRELLQVKAPADGIVYYGKAVRGQWQTAGMMESKLQRGGMLMPDEIILTIVKPRPFFVRATVEEKEFGNISTGQKGRVTPTALPELKLAGKIQKISTIPVSAGNFEVRLTLTDVVDSALKPGMTCTAKVVAYQKADALTVPAEGIFTDPADEDVQYVYLVGKGDKHAKAYVTTGRRSAGKVEIVQGLQAGDTILLERPAADAKKDALPKAEQPKKGV